MQQYCDDLIKTIIPMIPEMFSDTVNLSQEDYDLYEERAYNLLINMPETDVTTIPVIDAGMLEFAGEEEYEMLLAAMISVAMITAQNNVESFNNQLIKTGTNYELFDLANDITEQIKQVIRHAYMMKTDLIDGLNMILNHALESGTVQVPDQLLFISDGPVSHILQVEPDVLSNVQEKYTNAGVTMPQIIFWYFSPEPGIISVTDNNMVYVDGFSLENMEKVLNGQFH